MGIKSRFNRAKEAFFSSNEKAPESESIVYDNGSYGAYNPIIDDFFDGEKTPGELGIVRNTTPDHIRLRLRAYDMNLKTDIIKIITGKFFKWVIGNGLKLAAEPNETVLGMSGISEDLNLMQKNVEALFKLYSASKYSDYQRRDNFHEKASEAFKSAFLGGDCLCILRLDEFGPNMQVVDGEQVENPFDDTGMLNGHKIIKGIELNERGEHVAFWVKVDKFGDEVNIQHERISAQNSNGNLVAWMVYGDKARIDHHRGIPVITSILEKVTLLDRFTIASVIKAEQTANVVFGFEHSTNSTGENILKTSLTSKKNIDGKDASIYDRNEVAANQLRQAVSGTVLNLTPDSKLTSLSNESDTNFDQFFRAIFVTLCAAVEIPEEVALQKYESNYSASRAAINGWEFIVDIYRHKISNKTYKIFYRYWLEIMILSDKIKSNGFLVSKNKNDFMALEAYFSARFLGRKMPHIDPLKEAKAVRSLLGDDKTPLISYEQATEEMGQGDWRENYRKFLEEYKEIPEEHKEQKQDDKSDNSKQVS